MQRMEVVLGGERVDLWNWPFESKNLSWFCLEAEFGDESVFPF